MLLLKKQINTTKIDKVERTREEARGAGNQDQMNKAQNRDH